MSGDPNELLDTIGHPILRSKDGLAYGILDAINHQLTVILNAYNLVLTAAQANNAVGSDLDKLATLLKTGREDETDEELRTRLLAYVANYQRNTIDAVQDFVEELIGHRPNVAEYFDEDSAGAQMLMERFNLPRPYPVFIVQLPGVTYGVYQSLVQQQIGVVKAKGVLAIIDVIKEFVESFAEGIIIETDFQTTLVERWRFGMSNARFGDIRFGGRVVA